MQNDLKTHGLWTVTAPQAPVLGRFEGDADCEVAVIGGGFTGSSAALHLAEKGISVTLLEASEIGYGGSGRNVGLVNAGLWVLPSDVCKVLGVDNGERLNQVLGRAPEYVYKIIDKYSIDCEALHNGTLHCAHAKSGYAYLRQREEEWASRGAPVKLLNRSEAAQRIGSKAFHGALLDNRAGTVQPLSYAYGLAKAASQGGAAIHTQSPVIATERRQNKWVLTTPRGKLRAKAVIMATNAYIEFFRKELKETFIPFNFCQFSTQPLSPDVLETVLPGRNGIWDTNLVLSSMRLDKSNRLTVGSVGRANGFGTGVQGIWAKRMIQNVFPQIGKFEIQYGWHGTIAMTTNHIPRFHRMGPDFYMITSYNGRGIGPGTVCGKLLADLVSGGSEKDIPLPVTPIQPIFLNKARELFYETGARLYHSVQKLVIP